MRTKERGERESRDRREETVEGGGRGHTERRERERDSRERERAVRTVNVL